MRYTYFLLVFFLSCLDLKDRLPSYVPKDKGDSINLKLMSFNILSTVDPAALFDGYSRWGKRKQAVFNIINEASPDIIALQETSPSQSDDFKNTFEKNYEFIMNKGFVTDVLILYKRNRFELVEHGHWGLEDPFIFYRIRRIALWATLRDKKSGREFIFVATHLDAKDLKIKEIERLKEALKKFEGYEVPLFLAGDFNISPEHSGYRMIVEGNWRDPFVSLKLNPNDKSFNTYPYHHASRRIDHIFYAGSQVKPNSLLVLHDANAEPAPSDHRPVILNLSLLPVD